MPAESPLRTAPHVVREPDRGDRADRSAAEPGDPADDGEPQAAVVHRLRPACEERVQKLAAAMQKAAQVTAGRAVSERKRDLVHREARARRVDRHPGLAAEPGREREARLPRGGRKEALPRERFLGVEPAAQADQRASGCLRDAEAAALPLLEPRHGEVGSVLDERREVPLEIRVAEEQRPRVELALGERQRLALTPPRQTEDARPRFLGNARRAVPRPVVGDHDLGSRKRARQRPHRLADPLLLVARGDEDGELSHRWSSSGPGRAGGRRRSQWAPRRSSPSAHRPEAARARAAPVCSRSSRRSKATSARRPGSPS